ncbi:MAG: hypothetical protein Q8M66_06345, partial [Actinomycetota bacterium]|nr:hypothetical protein [Actinomycetota bacterium]
GGERLEIGALDAGRLAASLPDALAAAGVDGVTIAGPSQDIERGVIVAGNRMTVEISAASLAHSRRTELETVAARALFGEEE